MSKAELINSEYGWMLEARRLIWELGDSTVYPGENGAYLEGGGSGMCELPTEFFTHALMDADISTDEGLARFAGEYGLPFHPFRFETRRWKRITQSEADAIAYTNSLNTSPESYDHTARVSCAEARLALEAMRRASQALQDFVTTGQGDDAALNDFVNVCSGRITGLQGVQRVSDLLGAQWVIPGATSLFDDMGYHVTETTLTNAVANQMLETCGAEEPWHICNHCGRAYKYQASTQPRKSSFKPKTNRKQGGRLYCSDVCRAAKNDTEGNAVKREARMK